MTHITTTVCDQGQSSGHRKSVAMRTGPRANLEAPVRTLALAGAAHAPIAINLDQPGSYLNWNIFTISVANLVLIAVMVVIFGAALLLPFPGRHHPNLPPEETTEPDQIPGYKPAEGDEKMWTARARRWALSTFRPRRSCPTASPPT